MFKINQGIICNIIKKAREINISDDVTLPENLGDLSDAEWEHILIEYQNDPSYQELKNLINELKPDQQQDIIALMYIGRGDFTKNEWNEARKQVYASNIANKAY